MRLALWELIRISHLIQPRRRHSAKARGISRRSPCWKRTTLLQFHAWRNGLTFCWRRPRSSSKIQEPSSPSISPTRTEKTWSDHRIMILPELCGKWTAGEILHDRIFRTSYGKPWPAGEHQHSWEMDIWWYLFPQNGMIGFVDVFLIHSARSLFSHLPSTAAETKWIQVALMPCSHWTSEPASQLDVVHPTIQFMANDQNSTA